MDIFHLFSKEINFKKQSQNSFNIFLILTWVGIKHPSSLKFLQIHEKLNDFQKENFKLIITGKSSFDFNRKKTEAKELEIFLLSMGVLKEKIILEEEAMDTLGNMVFSYEIIKKEIDKERKNNKYTNICINIIIEGFHMSRNHDLFKNIYSSLLKIKFKYINFKICLWLF